MPGEFKGGEVGEAALGEVEDLVGGRLAEELQERSDVQKLFGRTTGKL